MAKPKDQSPLVCAKCLRAYQRDSEYGVCIDLYDECVWCLFKPATSTDAEGQGKPAQRDALTEAYRKRRVVFRP